MVEISAQKGQQASHAWSTRNFGGQSNMDDKRGVPSAEVSVCSLGLVQMQQ